MQLLVVKLGALGDGVMLLEALADLPPAVEVTWVTGKRLEPLLRLAARPLELLVVDEEAFYRGGLTGRLRGLASVWRRTLARRFDARLVAYRDWRYLAFLLSAFPARTFRFHPTPGRRHADEYRDVLAGWLGRERWPAERSPVGPLLRPPPLQPEVAAALDRAAHPRVALAPGGARNVLREDALRRWPLEAYRRLAAALQAAGCSVVLVGDEADGWAGEGFPPGTVSLVGRTDLGQVLGVFAGCAAVVTHDSGPLHLAGAVGAPVVGLFGPTVPSEKLPASHRASRALWGGAALACRPCYDGAAYPPCPRNRCLEDLPVEDVLRATLDALRG